MRRTLALLLICAGSGVAALTREQKLIDFNVLAQTDAAHYGPYHWKPWLAKVEATKNDIEFMEVLVDYTSSLDDAPVSLAFPSFFRASLGFTVDLFEGKPLIDSINRTTLPVARFAAQIGDEVVSIDAIPTATVIESLRKYYIAANPGSTRRWAANLLTVRPQSIIPSAALLGDTIDLGIRRANRDLETFKLTWVKTGVPLMDFGSVPVARAVKPGPRAIVEDDSIETEMRPIAGMLNVKLPRDLETVLNQGGPAPIFALPPGFRLRLAGGLMSSLSAALMWPRAKQLGLFGFRAIHRRVPR